MPFNHLILCCPLLLPSIFPNISVFLNKSVFWIRWPKYWSFSFNISPSNEHPGQISFRMDLLDLHEVQGTLKSLLQNHSSKASLLRCSAFFLVQLSHPYMTNGKTIALTRQTFVDKVISLLFNMLSKESEVSQSCPTLCNPMNCSTAGLPVNHKIPEFTQTHVHWVGDAIQPSHPLFSPSPLALKLSQHQSVFSNESALCIRWPKYWSFSFNISPSNEHPGQISFRVDWLDLLAVQGTLKSLLQHHSSKHQFFGAQLSL